MRDRGHNTAIVTAGGRGKRMPGAVKKQFRLLAGKPVLIHALSHFVVNELISRVIVTLPQEDICQTKEMLRHYFTADMQKIILVEGGKERQDSVYQGLLACPIDTEMVLIQDGVRPFVGLGMIEKLLQAAREMGAAIPAAPVKHTIKQVEGMQIIHTLPRESLVQVYTPQVYDYKLLLSCYHQAMAQGLYATDDAALLEYYGYPVQWIREEGSNIKITDDDDLLCAEMIYNNAMKDRP